MLKQFLRHLSENNLAQAGDKILLAVSGGIDSMVMLDLFIKSGISCEVAHVNFQLRGEESDGDELFVKMLCKNYCVPFHVNKVMTRARADEQGVSIQMAARDLRYQWFNLLVKEKNFQAVATAHHLNDSIETALFNWVNGTSLTGLTGIPLRNGALIRPLLFATRQQLEAYASENDIRWREDSSNRHDDYKRNFIRHRIVPLLKELNPSLENTFERQQHKLKGELSFVEYAFSQWKKSYVTVQEHSVTIEKSAFENIHSAGVILYKVIGEFGFNFDVCEEVLAALYGQSGTKFLSSTHSLVIDRDALLLMPIRSLIQEVIIERGQRQASAGEWRMKIEPTPVVLPATHQSMAVLDVSKLHFPLVWRSWRPGDFFYPLGMEQRKKISDFLIDAKVPLSEKERVTVLESKGEIVWIVGHRIDNRFKLTPETTEAMSFTVSTDFS